VNQPFFTELCLSGIHGFRDSADGYVATALLLSYFTANSWLTLVNSPLWQLVPVLGKNVASGQTKELWVRWTACFRRIDGVWRIMHDHVSVPADLEHGQAILSLTP